MKIFVMALGNPNYIKIQKKSRARGNPKYSLYIFHRFSLTRIISGLRKQTYQDAQSSMIQSVGLFCWIHVYWMIYWRSVTFPDFAYQCTIAISPGLSLRNLSNASNILSSCSWAGKFECRSNDCFRWILFFWVILSIQ